MMLRKEREGQDLATRVAARYRQEGYRVVVDPGAGDLPFDLGTYRPDMIAMKQSNGGDVHGYVIEVKKSTAQVPIDRYIEIANEVSERPGWRFLLVTEEDVRALDEPESDEELLTWEQIGQSEAQADRLLSSGALDAAFVTLWVALEAMLRRRAREMSIPVEHLPTPSLVKHLYSQGELSIDQYDRITALQAARNRVVHGFQAPDVNSDARQLNEVVRELSVRWRPQ